MKLGQNLTNTFFNIRFTFILPSTSPEILSFPTLVTYFTQLILLDLMTVRLLGVLWVVAIPLQMF